VYETPVYELDRRLPYLLISADGSAQQAAGITGVVRDTTGAVLPGVLASVSKMYPTAG
jgi:hypothetical protein